MNAADELRKLDIDVPAASVHLPGQLVLPASARGLVLFVHGSGSSRYSPRNQQVAQFLNERGFATLLFDLLTAEEHKVDRVTREHRFNIPLLAGRLMHAIDYAQRDPETQGLSIGLFGASTGAAAALIAAAAREKAVSAVVSRGGRPDLAGEALPKVRAPVLLIVGGDDAQVIDLNRRAATRLNVAHRTVAVEGASHLFEEPGTLETVQDLAADWFDEWLSEKSEAAHEQSAGSIGRFRSASTRDGTDRR